MNKFWRYAGPLVALLLVLALWSRWVASGVEDSAVAVESAAVAVDVALSALEGLDADSLRAEGVRLGGAVGASLRAVLDSVGGS